MSLCPMSGSPAGGRPQGRSGLAGADCLSPSALPARAWPPLGCGAPSGSPGPRPLNRPYGSCPWPPWAESRLRPLKSQFFLSTSVTQGLNCPYPFRATWGRQASVGGGEPPSTQASLRVPRSPWARVSKLMCHVAAECQWGLRVIYFACIYPCLDTRASDFRPLCHLAWPEPGTGGTPPQNPHVSPVIAPHCHHGAWLQLPPRYYSSAERRDWRLQTL